MGTEDHELLSQNLRVVTHRDSSFSARFYDRLFTRHPQLRELFGPNSAPVQEEMLSETLISAVAPLSEGATWFERLRQAENGLMKVILTP